MRGTANKKKSRDPTGAKLVGEACGPATWETAL